MSADIAVQISGVDAVAARLGRMRAGATDAQRTVIRSLGDRYLIVLKEETPRGRGEQPGTLRAGYDNSEQRYGPTGASYRITNAVPHLRYVLNGRGAVVATRARALRFVIDGQVIFRKRVGSAKANNFPPRARRRMQGEIASAPARIAGLIVRSYGE